MGNPEIALHKYEQQSFDKDSKVIQWKKYSLNSEAGAIGYQGKKTPNLT